MEAVKEAIAATEQRLDDQAQRWAMAEERERRDTQYPLPSYQH
jgi:hypothetical protein